MLALVVGVLLLAACGALPRPFQPADKTPPEVLEAALGARAGVFVEPIPGLAEGESERLTEALVAALRAHDVAAGRRANNRASYRISARRGEADRLHWSLAEPGGAIILGFEDQGGAERVQLVARRFADILNPKNPPSAGTVLLLAVRPVDGAPGDGRHALTRAMRRALKEYGLKAAESLEDATFIVLGSVYMGGAPESGEQQSITIDWTVMSPNGARIGTVNQSNTVPSGTLDGAWGPVARAVAENGAQGIVAMLERIGALE
ncbi:MAG: hypothetical protein QF449_07465 [Alphaproteobacteria bacterium]|jgi:hypothetical protein|nr:hypothetical protein [Alphaproteobacteria bacterium]